jgi:hypothetical protein
MTLITRIFWGKAESNKTGRLAHPPSARLWRTRWQACWALGGGQNRNQTAEAAVADVPASLQDGGSLFGRFQPP